MSISLPAWVSGAWAQLPVALLHTLWLGALAVVALLVLLRRTSARRPELRYAVCLAALGFVVAGWLVAWAGHVYWEAAGDSAGLGASAETTAVFVRTDRTDRWDPSDRSPAAPEGLARAVERNRAPGRPSFSAPLPWRAWLTNVWLAGVAVMALRTVLLVRGAGRLRRASVVCEEAHAQTILDELRVILGVSRNIALRVSDRIDGPMVMGILYPAILLPAYVLTGVPPEHLRAALAHELAHIRRYDYPVNLIQLLVESLLFFNPAVWWISRQIRIEREACCDALAMRSTGGATDYAHALAAFAAYRLTPSTALAMGSTQPERTLLERVQRILAPHDRPTLRLPWYSLIAFLVIGTALLAAFGGFSYLGVKLVAEAMSPQERIERIEAIQRDFGEPGTGELTKVKVSGTIRTEDGSPLPGDLQVHAMNIPRSTKRGSYYADNCSVGKAAFLGSAWSEDIYIWAIGEGFAPALEGPFQSDAGKAVPGVNVTLRRGRIGLAKVVDEHGTPVPGVDVSWRFPIRGGGSTVTHGKGRNTVTNDVGVARLEHCWDEPIAMTLRKPGYVELHEERLTIAPDEERTFVLPSMDPIRIHLRDGITGKPLPGAELHFGATHDPVKLAVSDLDQLLAVSDSAGTFRVESLRDGLEYWCYITAPGKRRLLLDTPIVAGQKELTFTMPPPLQIHGTILVPRDESGGDPEAVNLYVENPLGNLGSAVLMPFSRTLEVPLLEGQGEFFVDDIWPGTVILRVQKRTERLQVHDSIDGLVLDLRPAAVTGARQRRTVVLRLNAPEGHPAPSGTMRLDYIANPGDNAYSNVTLTLENGEVRYEVPVPTKIGCQAAELNGYWVKSLVGISVEPGEGLFILDIPSIPAGVIHGTVTGAPEDQFSVSTILVQSPADHDVFPLDSRNMQNGIAYTTSSLPLGGTYAIFGRNGAAAALSDPVMLTEIDPIREVNLVFAEGMPLEGRVTFPDGSPASGLLVTLHLETEYSHGFQAQLVATERDGAFRFDDVNFDLPLTYAVELDPEVDYLEVRQVVSRGKPVHIQLERGLVLEGRVVEDATGYPVPGVEVYATSTQTSIVDADARTDEEGRFRFTRLRDQVYSLGTRDGANPVSQVEVSPGEDSPVEIRVAIQPWSTLRPVAPGEAGGN